MMKKCSKCKQTKKLNEFSRARSTKDGLHCWCRVCMKEYQRAYRKVDVNKATNAESQKKYVRSAKGKIVIARRKKKHLSTFVGQVGQRLYSMRRRCNRPKCKNYTSYGGRGIQCLFKSTNDLMQHMIVDLGVDNINLFKDLVFHRIDNDGNYERGNICLLTSAEHHRVHRI